MSPTTFVPGFSDEDQVKKMLYQPLGKTGISLSKLSLGGSVYGGAMIYGSVCTQLSFPLKMNTDPFENEALLPQRLRRNGGLRSCKKVHLVGNKLRGYGAPLWLRKIRNIFRKGNGCTRLYEQLDNFVLCNAIFWLKRFWNKCREIRTICQRKWVVLVRNSILPGKEYWTVSSKVWNDCRQTMSILLL